MTEPKNILILGVQVPFTQGGAEYLIAGLIRELRAKGHFVDLVQLPFNALPKTKIAKHLQLWKSLELENFAGRNVDLVIPTKFPSYLANHPNKVLWLVHQHRQAYELYNTRFGDFSENVEDEALRQLIFEADAEGIGSCKKVFTIAQNVSNRLEKFQGIKSTAMPPPPPLGNNYYVGEKGDYILSVGRLCSIKRVDLIVRAMAEVSRRLKLKIVGLADEPATENYLKSEIAKHHLGERVEFLGRVSDQDLLTLYANCFAVYYAPHNEDYGFVTLEARASGKPVVTAKDSGTVLDFIRDQENGLIVEPLEKEIAGAFNRLLEDENLYSSLSYRENPLDLCCSWDKIVDCLLAE